MKKNARHGKKTLENISHSVKEYYSNIRDSQITQMLKLTKPLK